MHDLKHFNFIANICLRISITIPKEMILYQQTHTNTFIQPLEALKNDSTNEVQTNQLKKYMNKKFKKNYNVK